MLSPHCPLLAWQVHSSLSNPLSVPLLIFFTQDPQGKRSTLVFFSLLMGVQVVGSVGLVGDGGWRGAGGRGKRKQCFLPPFSACEPDDVTCHLQLMKVMMACLSAAYVHHLLGSTVLELPPARGAALGKWRHVKFCLLHPDDQP